MTNIQMRQEINEAIAAADNTIACLKTAKKELNSAKGWE